MNSTTNNSTLSISNCSLQDRVYTPTYLFFKLLNSTYLRVLIGPGILLNTLCLLVFSRPRLASKSTTVVFLRFLALFDILSILLKYIRAEINYQSTEKDREVFILIPWVCKTLYVLMNASISIAMWIIVLMSLDKAVAVTYPLKSGIWITHRRAFYICCYTIGILTAANLSFIHLSGISLTSRTNRKYCGLNEKSFVVDLLTASILPMALITAANIVIAVVLHRVSRVSFDGRISEDNGKRDSDAISMKQQISTSSVSYRPSAVSAIVAADATLASKRRTSAQVTRMLLAVTLSLIICNIPNTIFFIFVKIYDTRQLLIGRLCREVSDYDIDLYKLGFYSSVTQDILSDLPHIFNFFLYCLAGKKFRSIFMNEARHFLLDLNLIKRKERSFTHGTYFMNSDSAGAHGFKSVRERFSSYIPLSNKRRTVEVSYNGGATETLISDQNRNSNRRYSADPSSIRYSIKE